jgi:hypothetical protein
MMVFIAQSVMFVWEVYALADLLECVMRRLNANKPIAITDKMSALK